jgi:hypothetical protein
MKAKTSISEGRRAGLKSNMTKATSKKENEEDVKNILYDYWW